MKSILLGLCVVFAFLLLADDALAQPFLRLDGHNYVTTCVKLQPPPGPGAQPGDPECAAVPFIEDGWTSKFRCSPDPLNPMLEAESYIHFAPEDEFIIFVNKIKVAINPFEPVAQSFQVVEDIFVIPCNPRTIANPQGEDFIPLTRPLMLFIDDVIFPPIFVDEPEIAVEYLCAVYVPLQDIADFLLQGQDFAVFDWFACADLDGFGTYYGQPPLVDVDGDTFIDACVQLGGYPGKFIRPRVGFDDKGANLTLFLLNRNAVAPIIEVFEPYEVSGIPPFGTPPPNPPGPTPFPGLPGMIPGENGTTRPWCFTLFGRPPGK